jgi:hypothetical protein
MHLNTSRRLRPLAGRRPPPASLRAASVAETETTVGADRPDLLSPDTLPDSRAAPGRPLKPSRRPLYRHSRRPRQ